ncbi:MAG: MAPEG family protein [Myxococcota bacterium]
MIDATPYQGPILVTGAYILLYYLFQIRINRVKSRLRREYAGRGEKFDRYFGQDRFMLAADRTQLNMLEHMPPFLLLMWLHAVFVSPLSASVAGGVYLVARIGHPILMGSRLGRGIRLAVLIATVPGYLVIVYLLAGVAGAAFGLL